MPTIGCEQLRFLEMETTLEEVKRTVWSCGTDKSPGYDSFNFKFFRKIWDVIGNEILFFVQDFMHSGKMTKATNVI